MGTWCPCSPMFSKNIVCRHSNKSERSYIWLHVLMHLFSLTSVRTDSVRGASGFSVCKIISHFLMCRFIFERHWSSPKPSLWCLLPAQPLHTLLKNRQSSAAVANASARPSFARAPSWNPLWVGVQRCGVSWYEGVQSSTGDFPFAGCRGTRALNT